MSTQEGPIKNISETMETFPPSVKPRQPVHLKVLIAVIVVNMLLTLGTVYGYHRLFSQKIVAIDVKGFLAEQRDLYLAGKITMEQATQNLEVLGTTVKKQPGNTIILMGDCTIGPNTKFIKPGE